MKTFVVKLFLTLVLLVPTFCFADMLCSSHPRYTMFLKIKNIAEFPDYNFYFTTGVNYIPPFLHGDSTLAVNEKPYSFEAYNGHFDEGLFAINKKTGVETSTVWVKGNPNGQTLITIQKIENDSIYFKTEVAQTQSAGFNSKPVSPVAKLLLLISFCGLLFYTTTLIFQKQKT